MTPAFKTTEGRIRGLDLGFRVAEDIVKAIE